MSKVYAVIVTVLLVLGVLIGMVISDWKNGAQNVEVEKQVNELITKNNDYQAERLRNHDMIANLSNELTNLNEENKELRIIISKMKEEINELRKNNNSD